MANPTSEKIPPPENAATAALLSYLVPGLGQIYQGRVGKGVLFFVCVYALFFYGMYLGSWKNVFILKEASDNSGWLGWLPFSKESAVRRVLERPHFAGQFFVGVAAWPAIYQAWAYDERQNDSPPLKGFMRQPPEEELQKLQRDGDKTWDLAWVYTVIAGVLNVMVIYDAF